MKAIDNIRKNLAALIAERGTNEAAVAKKATLGHTGVRDILSGRSKNPTQGTLTKIAAALEVDVSAITGQSVAMIPARVSTPSGLAESAIPFAFQAHQIAIGRNQNPLHAIFGPDVVNAATFRVSAHQTAFGYLPGDILIADISRLPVVGEICVVTVADDETAISATHLRRYLPPFLAAGDPADVDQLLLIDGPGVTVRYPVIGMIRGIIAR